MPNIIAIKEASGDVNVTSAIFARVPSFQVFSGDDSLTLPLMALGASGVISVASNLAPAALSALCAAAAPGGDISAARKAHHALFPVMNVLFIEGNPVPCKRAMQIAGERHERACACGGGGGALVRRRPTAHPRSRTALTPATAPAGLISTPTCRLPLAPLTPANDATLSSVLASCSAALFKQTA